MPVFMIKRTFAEALHEDLRRASDINAVNDEEDVRWIYSFISKDRLRAFCLYEAESVDAIRRAAERTGLPVGDVVELTELLDPSGRFRPLGQTELV